MVLKTVAHKLNKRGTQRPEARPREKFEALIRNLRKSEPFRQFQRDAETFVIQEAKLRHLLGATLETPVRVLKQNLQYFLEAAMSYEDMELVAFLSKCREFLPR
jgi:hypothetical protein